MENVRYELGVKRALCADSFALRVQIGTNRRMGRHFAAIIRTPPSLRPANLVTRSNQRHNSMNISKVIVAADVRGLSRLLARPPHIRVEVRTVRMFARSALLCWR